MIERSHPYLWLMNPDPDPEGPKTYGSDGSGSATLAKHMYMCIDDNQCLTSHRRKIFYERPVTMSRSCPTPSAIHPSLLFIDVFSLTLSLINFRGYLVSRGADRGWVPACCLHPNPTAAAAASPTTKPPTAFSWAFRVRRPSDKDRLAKNAAAAVSGDAKKEDRFSLTRLYERRTSEAATTISPRHSRPETPNLPPARPETPSSYGTRPETPSTSGRSTFSHSKSLSPLRPPEAAVKLEQPLNGENLDSTPNNANGSNANGDSSALGDFTEKSLQESDTRRPSVVKQSDSLVVVGKVGENPLPPSAKPRGSPARSLTCGAVLAPSGGGRSTTNSRDRSDWFTGTGSHNSGRSTGGGDGQQSVTGNGDGELTGESRVAAGGPPRVFTSSCTLSIQPRWDERAIFKTWTHLSYCISIVTIKNLDYYGDIFKSLLDHVSDFSFKHPFLFQLWFLLGF